VGKREGSLEDLEVTDGFDGVFSGKTVLVTGHTGFKGSWLSLWLKELGAKVAGYALAPETNPNLYDQLGLSRLMDSRLGDVRDFSLLQKTMQDVRPDIIFHLAAQPLVRRSYQEPLETFSTNVLGTANLIEAARKTTSVRVCQVITTDKCYENRETGQAYREDDRLGGRDPYSASKACAELVVSSMRASFFQEDGAASVSSTRAGNVIGGGDWSQDRLVPDCARALAAGQAAQIRNPRSVRPWQFVLEPLCGYLQLAMRQWQSPKDYAEAWNFGPRPGSARPVGEVADLFVKAWGSGRWQAAAQDGQAPHEAGQLQLDSAKAAKRLGWRPVYTLEEGLEQTARWYRESGKPGFSALEFTRRQIQDYMKASHAAEFSTQS